MDMRADDSLRSYPVSYTAFRSVPGHTVFTGGRNARGRKVKEYHPPHITSDATPGVIWGERLQFIRALWLCSMQEVVRNG